MKIRVLCALFLLFSVHPPFSGRVTAQESFLFQELGVFYTAMNSNHVELPSLSGMGAFSRWQVAPGWLVRLSYRRAFEHTEKTGVVCDNYPHRINCRPEPTETDVTLSGVRGEVSKAIRLGRFAELGLGGGVSFNHVKPEAVDLHGGPADLLVTNTGQIGYLASLSATDAPSRRVPILLVGGFSGHRMRFNGCSGEDPPQYDPFCGWTTLREIELGLSYVF